MQDPRENRAVPNPIGSNLLFLFPYRAKDQVSDVEAGRIPSERLGARAEKVIVVEADELGLQRRLSSASTTPMLPEARDAFSRPSGK